MDATCSARASAIEMRSKPNSMTKRSKQSMAKRVDRPNNTSVNLTTSLSKPEVSKTSIHEINEINSNIGKHTTDLATRQTITASSSSSSSSSSSYSTSSSSSASSTSTTSSKSSASSTESKRKNTSTSGANKKQSSNSKRKAKSGSKKSKKSQSTSGQCTLITETISTVENEVWICPACEKFDDGTPMIGCDNCNDWYHWDCVGITIEPKDEEAWFCLSCIEIRQKSRKRLKRS